MFYNKGPKIFCVNLKKLISGLRDLCIPECYIVIAVDGKNHVKQINKHIQYSV